MKREKYPLVVPSFYILSGVFLGLFWQHVYMHGHDHVGQHLVDKGVVYVGNGVGGFGTHPAHTTNNTVWFRSVKASEEATRFDGSLNCGIGL